MPEQRRAVGKETLVKPFRLASLLIPAAVFFLLLPARAGGQAQPTCTAGKTGKAAAITGKEAWDLASARARAWQADAAPFEFTNTSSGPLDAEGRSTDWSVSFSSAKGSAVNMVSITDGEIRCFSIPAEGGRVLKFVDQVTFDTRMLYYAAQKAGGDKVQGARIMAGLDQGTSGVPEWHLNYANAQGKEVLSVVFDARTGKVSNVFHSK
jgi:hypothetical protein